MSLRDKLKITTPHLLWNHTTYPKYWQLGKMRKIETFLYECPDVKNIAAVLTFHCKFKNVNKKH